MDAMLIYVDSGTFIIIFVATSIIVRYCSVLIYPYTPVSVAPGHAKQVLTESPINIVSNKNGPLTHYIHIKSHNPS